MKLLQVFVLAFALMLFSFGCAASTNHADNPAPAAQVTNPVQAVQVVQPVAPAPVAAPAPAPAPTHEPGLVARVVDYLKSGIEIVLAAAVVFVWLTFGWVAAAATVGAIVLLLWPVAIGAVIAFGSLMLQRYAVPYTTFVNGLLARVWPLIQAAVAFVLKAIKWTPGTTR